MRFVLYVLAFFGLLFVGQIAFMSYVGYYLDSKATFSIGTSGFDQTTSFHNYVYFNPSVGFDSRARQDELPNGDARLTGNFTYKNQPVSGIKLKIYLDNYVSEELVTDAKGQFSLSAPAGEYALNLLEVDAWENKPEGNYLIISGREMELGEHLQFNEFGKSGEPIRLESGQPLSIGTFRLTQNIEILEPVKGQPKTFEQPELNTLRWVAHPDVITYEVDIRRVERNGSSSTHSSIFTTTTDQTEFPLQNLKFVEDNDEARREYEIKLKGYDSDKKFVTQSSFKEYSGFYVDGKRIITEYEIPGIDLINDEAIEKVVQAHKIVSATGILLDLDMVSSAEELVGKVDSGFDDWRLDRVIGYLHAKKGNCETANAYFTQARSKSGFNCISKKHLASCQREKV